MKNLVFPDEIRVKVRQDMADLYRKIRKDNHVMARLLFKRSEETVVELKTILFGDDNEA